MSLTGLRRQAPREISEHATYGDAACRRRLSITYLFLYDLERTVAAAWHQGSWYFISTCDLCRGRRRHRLEILSLTHLGKKSSPCDDGGWRCGDRSCSHPTRVLFSVLKTRRVTLRRLVAFGCCPFLQIAVPSVLEGARVVFSTGLLLLGRRPHRRGKDIDAIEVTRIERKQNSEKAAKHEL